MRVLLITGSLAPMRCGVGDYTLRLAGALAAAQGVEVAILTSRGAMPDDTRPIRLFRLMEKWSLLEARIFKQVLKEWSPDIVHIQYPTQGYAGGVLPVLMPLLATRYGARVVRTWHEIPCGRSLVGFIFEAMVPGGYVVVRPEFRRKLCPVLRPMINSKRGGLVMSASSLPRSVLTEKQRHELRARLVNGKSRLIVFFGFLYPFKGVEQIFEIADPARDQIVIAGEAGVDEPYYRSLEHRAGQDPWRGSVTMTGFLSDEAAADLMATADAVVLPFRKGGGFWNSSIHAAVLQGGAVITTSKENRGLDKRHNVYFAAPGDVKDMKAALNRMAGHRRPFDPEIDGNGWRRIAEQHVAIYEATRSMQVHERPSA